jgi:glycosyltransferase involved in cell wall biosynthesis
MLALFAIIYGRATLIPIVVDAHNAGVFPFEGKNWWANKIAEYLFKKATFTLVTNQALAKYVNKRGGRALILPDPLPEFENTPPPMKLLGKSNALFICSFANDEPYQEVIKASKFISKDIYIYITGKYKGNVDDLKKNLPLNVILTGYLPENDFIQMLHSVDCVIDLTTRENCLVCGAYEAVAAGKVLIVSGTKTLREYFNKGTLYTDNTHKNIAEKIMISVRDKDKLVQEIKDLKIEKTIEWSRKHTEIENILKFL